MAPDIHLSNALTLIRQGYCLGANAKDSKGIACGVLDPDAKSWSLYGALLRVIGVSTGNVVPRVGVSAPPHIIEARP
jgi:hypothetical protein